MVAVDEYWIGVRSICSRGRAALTVVSWRQSFRKDSGLCTCRHPKLAQDRRDVNLGFAKV
jgi:hypothetical protein